MKEMQTVPLPRTVKVPAAAWQAAKAKAEKTGSTMRQLIEDAVRSELPDMVQTLRQIGVRAECQPNKIVRVPISDATLALLKHGREQTGLAGIQMLGLCLQKFADRRRCRRAKA